ncbi:hypothetical protein LLH06_15745 [Mucilaginibacter daejeonensis]|uniref:hypothetical protein n=1 Tax=Mucilaginibacter daejeonensis TaxID=398049 RepID=UPI001D176D35|nr:hypothetical protein [Mucilaginibacter daejeonensis]UEG52411.1 hypothetical protein LLH06_15745 [Mucilaginibacter daejeonensis]
MLFLFSVTWGTVSGWYIPLCVLLGVLYAWLLYRDPVILDNRMRWLLAALRAVAVSLVGFLLVSPLIRTVNYEPQKPLVIIAQDNSTSIKAFKPKGFDLPKFHQQLASLKAHLGDQYDVREFHFDRDLQQGLSSAYNGDRTDIASALTQLKEQYAGQNIGAIVLATDGLYDHGADPRYVARDLKTNIYTVALGDTIPRRDLVVGNVNYNRTAFLGNDMILEVLVEAYQSRGETMRLTVAEDGRKVFTQSIPVNDNSFRKVVPVKVSADKKGIHRFTIGLAPAVNELTLKNNTETVYIEVLDARQKILLVYDAAHPDIGVVKTLVEHDRNFELKAVALDKLSTVKLPDYGLLMLYQVTAGDNLALKNYVAQSKVPVWYMAGARSNLDDLNQEQNTIRIIGGRADVQEEFAVPVKDFSLFTLSDSTLKRLERFPPLMAPFGNYGSAPGASVLLKQRIGSVSTTYPLLAFNEVNGRRTATLTGEGIWRWNLAEFQEHNDHLALEELFGQSIQYLTANTNRQRFRVYPAHNVFDEGDDVILNAELYNDALQLVNTPDVSVDIRNEKGKSYGFLFTRTGQSYQLNAGALPVGEYSFKANSVLGKQRFNAAGKFTIKPLDLESRQSTADHALLYDMAKRSGAQMLQPSQLGKLVDLIRHNDNIKTIVYDDEHYSDLINNKWLFGLILILLSVEWFLRKREGEV